MAVRSKMYVIVPFVRGQFIVHLGRPTLDNRLHVPRCASSSPTGPPRKPSSTVAVDELPAPSPTHRLSVRLLPCPRSATAPTSDFRHPNLLPIALPLSPRINEVMLELHKANSRPLTSRVHPFSQRREVLLDCSISGD